MNIAIFGCGYVGLVTGACFAKLGHRVICIDNNQEKITQLQQGVSPIYEPGLSELIQAHLALDTLTFTTNAALAIHESQLLFIAVGTPSYDDGSVDLRFVFNCATTIAETMNDYKVVINKSTVPVGTANRVKQHIADILSARKQAITFDVCANPEFLKEGSAINDFMNADRIVIGTDSERVMALMLACYQAIVVQSPLLRMEIKAAELTKYAANAMLATKISFINEISNIAERLHVDIEEVRQGIGSDKRIGYAFINPGCGYGGSCFPKDLRALIHVAKLENYQPVLLVAVELVNEWQQHVLFDKLKSVFAGHLSGKTIAIWGISFKPHTDDLREASSRVLLEALWEEGVNVRVYDPAAMPVLLELYGYRQDLICVNAADQAIHDADALVICTEWDEFRAIDLICVKHALRFPLIIDGRNLYDPQLMQEAGLLYFGIGRGADIRVI